MSRNSKRTFLILASVAEETQYQQARYDYLKYACSQFVHRRKQIFPRITLQGIERSGSRFQTLKP